MGSVPEYRLVSAEKLRTGQLTLWRFCRQEGSLPIPIEVVGDLVLVWKRDGFLLVTSSARTGAFAVSWRW